MPTDFSDGVTNSKPNARSQSQGPSRVRIGLRLTPYHKVVYSTASGSQIKHRPDETLSHTLRARMDRPNHFFISDFHIETTPLAWDKAKRIYKMRLTMHRRFGSYGQIEESLGSLDVAGEIKGEKGLYILHGSSAAKMKDKRGQPVVDIVAGYAPNLASAQSQGEGQKTQNRPAASQAGQLSHPEGAPANSRTGGVPAVARPTSKNSKNPWEQF